jgi:hypothetical protein
VRHVIVEVEKENAAYEAPDRVIFSQFDELNKVRTAPCQQQFSNDGSFLCQQKNLQLIMDQSESHGLNKNCESHSSRMNLKNTVVTSK